MCSIHFRHPPSPPPPRTRRTPSDPLHTHTCSPHTHPPDPLRIPSDPLFTAFTHPGPFQEAFFFSRGPPAEDGRRIIGSFASTRARVATSFSASKRLVTLLSESESGLASILIWCRLPRLCQVNKLSLDQMPLQIRDAQIVITPPPTLQYTPPVNTAPHPRQTAPDIPPLTR